SVVTYPLIRQKTDIGHGKQRQTMLSKRRTFQQILEQPQQHQEHEIGTQRERKDPVDGDQDNKYRTPPATGKGQRVDSQQQCDHKGQCNDNPGLVLGRQHQGLLSRESKTSNTWRLRSRRAMGRAITVANAWPGSRTTLSTSATG